MRISHIFSASLVVALFALVATPQAQAQLQVGGGLVFGTDIGQLGVQGNGTYQITDNIRGAADLTFFFPDEELGIKVTLWTLDANVHYLFSQDDGQEFYGIGGLGIATAKAEIEDFGFGVGGASVSDSEVGLNVGGGAQFGMPFGNFFAELIYQLGGGDQLVVAGGVRIPLGGGN